MEYEIPTTEIDHYTYTYEVDSDATINVYISGSGEEKYCYLKINDVWQRCSAVYKKVNGSWILQSNLATVFDNGTNYKLN